MILILIFEMIRFPSYWLDKLQSLLTVGYDEAHHHFEQYKIRFSALCITSKNKYLIFYGIFKNESFYGIVPFYGMWIAFVQIDVTEKNHRYTNSIISIHNDMLYLGILECLAVDCIKWNSRLSYKQMSPTKQKQLFKKKKFKHSHL